MSSKIYSVEVDPGDPHNDQIAAQARKELFQHVESMRDTLRQGNESAAIAVAAVALDGEVEFMPRVRLASLLAAALVELAALLPVVEAAKAWRTSWAVILYEGGSSSTDALCAAVDALEHTEGVQRDEWPSSYPTDD